MAVLATLKLLAQPPVQQWPATARFAAHTALWTLWLTLLQYAVLGLVKLLARMPHVKQTARSPQLSDGRMLVDATLGYVGWAWPLGLFAAWLNPGAPGGFTWDYTFPNLIVLLYFCLATLMAYDAYSYFLHRWLHLNKTAFRWLHAKHHEHQAALDVRTAGYMTVLEGIFSDALPMLAIYALGAATGNWWYSFAGVWNAFHIVMVGHAGHDVSLTHPLNIPILLLNPVGGYGFLAVSVHATPKDHEDHHTYPRRNFSYFFTFWDDRYGTSQKNHMPSTLLFLATHGVYQAIYLACHHLEFKYTSTYCTFWLLAYVVITPGAAAAVANYVGLPELTRRLFGWFMDLYRRDAYVTYAPEGSPGVFKPLPATATERRLHPTDISDLASTDDDDICPVKNQNQHAAVHDSKPPAYLFACHPTGLISRGAFLTFGARGWCSPVSALPKVRMAVASCLLQIPIMLSREFLLACGCIPADWSGLKKALLSGTSVAITPGGWAESRYVQSYKLVLKKRRGFVALAAETGAALVPVLCLGEQDLVGEAEPLFYILKWIIPHRPRPVHVVFGEALLPREQESVGQLHARYIEALLRLAKQHGVKLDIVE